MRRFYLYIATAVLTVATFTGCGHEHTWVAATCQEPKTCSVCHKPEGEVAEHDWQPATCTQPMTCSMCGNMVGDPLGHTPTQATYWDASICTTCGETVAEPIEPDFSKHGLSDKIIGLRNTYDYTTCCYGDDKDKKTVGHATFTEYDRFDSDEEHEAQEGYEWIHLVAEVIFDDDNAYEYGFSTNTCFEDYYQIDFLKASEETVETKKKGVKISKITINYKGQDYVDSIAEIHDWQYSKWKDRSRTATREFYFKVPKDYDGLCVGLRDDTEVWEEGMHVYDLNNDNSLFFRMN